MQHVFPVYTQEKECHDCYKCVRQCPVKAIRVIQERAYIVPERCVACGRCVRVCPSGAKHVRSDLGRTRFLLNSPAPTYVSLAPSWAAVHPDWNEGQIVSALRRLGFSGVGETASGAEAVSTTLAEELAMAKPGLYISSACPGVVDLVRKHFPDMTGNITPVASPALTHCRMLREQLGENISVIFIGPCAAKKTEADENPELMNLALTFAELDEMLAEQSIHPERIIPGEEDVFLNGGAREGAVYPLEGGMIETLRHCGCPESVQAQSISGLQRLKTSLERAHPEQFSAPFFLEGLACRGGCVNGPCSTDDPPPLEGIIAIRNRTHFSDRGSRSATRVGREYTSLARGDARFTDAEIRGAMARVGKSTPDDELNCGGCGYDTCRTFARALLSGDAETSMCAYYMRTIAQRKANALFRCIPSGVFIVGTDLRIVESNAAFAGLFSDQITGQREGNPGLAGEDIENFMPCGALLRAALRTGEEIRRECLKVGDRLFDVIIFSIELHKMVGAIIEDVTLNEMRRDQIARRAREVIKRNIATVQEIACRLGEHMADTEILLNSIAEGYGDDPDDE